MKSTEFKLSTLDLIIKHLKEGQVIAHPADTCFGFAADPMSKFCVQKIQEIKGREKLKPMSLMLPTSYLDRSRIKPGMTSGLDQWAEMNEFSWKVARQLFPGPVTLILPKGTKIPDHYFPETDLIGIRFPDHKPTQFILEAFGGPLITTSANPSGEPICFHHDDVIKAFETKDHQPSLVVKGELKTHKTASTVLKVEKDHVKILREGPIKKEDLESMGIDCR